jgi:hypothetical protein
MLRVDGLRIDAAGQIGFDRLDLHGGKDQADKCDNSASAHSDKYKNRHCPPDFPAFSPAVARLATAQYIVSQFRINDLHGIP